MFSQFRSAIEQLAQPVHEGAGSSSNDTNGGTEPISRSQSLDTKSSAQLADSAISSLRKSFVTTSRSSGSQPTQQNPPNPTPGGRKSTLEERLRRAALTAADGSGASPISRTNSRGSPAPTNRKPLMHKTMSPASTPLPGSPAVKPVSEPKASLDTPTDLALADTDPLGISVPQVVESTLAQENSPPPTSPPPPETPEQTQPQALEKEATVPQPVVIEDTVTPVTSVTVEEAPAVEKIERPADEVVKAEDTTTPETSKVVAQEASVSEEETDEDEDEEEDDEEEEDEDEDEEKPLGEKVEETPGETTAAPEESDPPERTTELTVADAQPSTSPQLEDVQERLRQVEQRFADVSTSFKRLQAEKRAVDALLREQTPVESIRDIDTLRDYFVNLKEKEQVYHDEIKRLNQKLEVQDERLDELRDTHRKEAASRSEELEKIRTQLKETEMLFQAAQRATTEVEDASESQKANIARMAKEVEAAKTLAKEEEEKRVKAITLLKTVRQKLVKAEKDRDDATKLLQTLQEKEGETKGKEQADQAKMQQELDSLKASHASTVSSLKAQFEKDLAALRERHEQDISKLRAQFDAESSSSKETFTRELASKSNLVATLQTSLNNATREKNQFFDQLQLRQAELESTQEHHSSLQHENNELQFQLREANERLALLQEEIAELVRNQESRSRDPAASADEIARAVSATETKYEAKLNELRRNLNTLEKERYESEAEWSNKLKEKVKELEEYKRRLGTTAKSREDETKTIAALKAELLQSQDLVKVLQMRVLEIPQLQSRLDELEARLREQEEEIKVKATVYEKQTEEAKVREGQLRANIKTLRDELRKVQSSAALLEKQRNPGVGYWTSKVAAEGNVTTDSQVSVSSPSSGGQSRPGSPSPSSAKGEEDVNIEYLRNVILQFLEHKEMRPHLVKVLSIILHFTPQETRRLVAKV